MTTRKEVACIIRNTGAGWAIIDASGHVPIGVTSLVQGPNSVMLTFDFTQSATHTFICGPDEFFAQQGFSAGASVGWGTAEIFFGKNGVAKTPAQVVAPSGNFFIFGLFSVEP